VICNLHSLEVARKYCNQLVGMGAGRVVFDGAPAMLTDDAARTLYDIASDDAPGADPTLIPEPAVPGAAIGHASA